MIDPATLAPLPFFRDMAPAALRALAARAVERRFAAGEALFTAGAQPRGLFVTARLAAWVLARGAASGGRPFTLGQTQGELAEELGTVREVVVRSLRARRASGAIRALGRGRFEIADEAALRKAAHGARVGL